MAKRGKYGKIIMSRPSGKLEGFLIVIFIILSFLMVPPIIADAEQPSVSVKAYKIESVAFGGYKTISDINKIPIIFCAYGEKPRVAYPAPKDSIIKDPSVLIKKCSEAISQNVDKIVMVQLQNQSVGNYLTADNRIAPLTKTDFLNIVNHSQEYTFQRDVSAGKDMAEFRSKEFQVDNNGAFCIYVTFVCSQDKGDVEKIIISAVKLES